MARERITISLMMKTTALVAINLALLIGVFERATDSPFIVYLVVALDLVLVQAVLLRRPLRAFHYAFLVAGAVSSFVLGVLSQLWVFPWTKLASASGVFVAWAVGLAAATSMQEHGEQLDARGQRIAAFVQGMLIGFASFGLAATVAAWFMPEAAPPQTARWYAHIFGVIACPILGGLTVVRLTRSGGHPPAEDEQGVRVDDRGGPHAADGVLAELNQIARQRPPRAP